MPNNLAIEIIPAIMPKDWSDLESTVARVAPYVETVQLDIMDGKFVPAKTWPYQNEKGELKDVADEKYGFPFWDTINYEIDLMVATPKESALEWIRAGASRVILHIESSPDIKTIIEGIRDTYGYPKDVAVAPEVVLAVGHETPLEKIFLLVPLLDGVQIMGIKRIGFQGESFAPETVERVAQLHKEFPELSISIDGGVNEVSAPKLISAGATRLVSGSYILTAQNIGEAIVNLEGM